MDAELARDLAAAYAAHADRLAPRTLVGWSGADIPGVEQQIVGTWMARNTWDNMAKGEWLAYDKGYTAFLTAHPDRAADIGVPLVPHDSGQPLNGLLDEVISGARDGAFVTLGGHLAKLGPATTYARLFWEMNMRPFPADQLDRGKFRAAWRRAVPLIRAGFAIAARPGQRLHVVFCPISDGANYAEFWPGADVVDVVALDAYASAWGTSTPDPVQLLATVRGYLDKLAAFGRLHGKPVALGEWGNWQAGGTGTTNRGRGDFPEYIDAVLDWAQANPVAYLCYFNIPDGGVGQILAQTPKSLARLQARAT